MSDKAFWTVDIVRLIAALVLLAMIFLGGPQFIREILLVIVSLGLGWSIALRVTKQGPLYRDY